MTPHTSFAPSVGSALPETQHTPNNVQLFLYNAALWNAHRIHFDLPYAVEVEGYPGLVIPGPLMGDWLARCVDEWLGDAGRIVRLEYSNRRSAVLGETLRAGGQVSAVNAEGKEIELELFVKNQEGEVLTPGTARAVLY